MRLKKSIIWILLGIAWIAFASSSVALTSATEMDWLVPYTDKSPWDPFAPEASYGDISPGDVSTGSQLSDSSLMVSGDPFYEGISILDATKSVNQIYFQTANQLTTSGFVELGEPFHLWIYVGFWGSFVLYDYSEVVMWQSLMQPGWYRITLYAEILTSHLYRFNATYPSNNLPITVNPGGYPTSYSLVGRVVDAYGYGIPGANVRITGGEGGIFSTTTNYWGYYGMNLPSGTYSVTAERDGYSFTQGVGRVWFGAVSAAEKIVGFPIAGGIPYGVAPLEWGWLHGRVIDQSYRSIANAIVSVDGMTTIADDLGSFWLALRPGSYTINVDKENYIFRSVTTQILPGETTYEDITGRELLVLGSGGR